MCSRLGGQFHISNMDFIEDECGHSGDSDSERSEATSTSMKDFIDNSELGGDDSGGASRFRAATRRILESEDEEEDFNQSFHKQSIEDDNSSDDASSIAHDGGIEDRYGDVWSFLLGDLYLQPQFEEIHSSEEEKKKNVVPDRDDILKTLCSLVFEDPMFLGPESDVIKFEPLFSESKHVNIQVVRDATLKYYDFFGGDIFADLDTPTIFLVAKAKYPTENPIEVFNQRRAYIIKLAVLMLAQRKCIASFNDTDENVFLGRFRQISHRVVCLGNIIKSIVRMRSVAMLPKELPWTDTVGAVLSDMRAAHRLTSDLGVQAIFICEDYFAEHGYRRYNDEVWEPVFGTIAGKRGTFFLHAFKKVKVNLGGSTSSMIKDVINYCVCSERMHPDNVTIVKDKMNKVIERFTASSNQCFPVLQFNNNLRSFLDGVYDMKTDRFYRHGCHPPPPGIAPKLIKQNFEEDKLMSTGYIDPCDFVSGKWFDMLKTEAPAFMSILLYQYKKSVPGTTEAFNTYENPELCVRVALAMLGRLIFEVCELDPGYERFLALIGIAGVGKTKIAEIFCQLVPNMFKLQASTEETFGYENIIGSDLIMVEEISSGSNISQSFMLQVGSSNGRDQAMKLAVSRKYKSQKQHIITQPLVMVGNSFPSKWSDGQGQMTRRLVALLFDRPVEATKRDSQIPALMKVEMPVIVVGLVRAYHSMVRCLGTRSLDVIIPSDMSRDRDEIISSTSEVRKFLHQGSSPRVFYDRKGIRSGMMIPVTVLCNEFEKFKARSLNRTREPMSQGEFNSILNITKAKLLVMNATDTQSNSGIKMVMGCPVYSEFKIMGVGEGGSVSQTIEARWPAVAGFTYKLSDRYVLDYKSTEPIGYVVGIELNLMGTSSINERTREQREASMGDQQPDFRPTPKERSRFHQKYAKYNTIDKRIENQNNYTIDQHEVAYLMKMKTVVQRSFTMRNNSTIDGKEVVITEEEEKKNRMILRRQGAHVVHSQQNLSLMDAMVIDQLFGMPFYDEDGEIVRKVGKYLPRKALEVDNMHKSESRSKNAVHHGYVDIDDIRRGVYTPLPGAVHANRFFRFEVSALISRIEVYKNGARGADRHRYDRLLRIVRSVYKSWSMFNSF